MSVLTARSYCSHSMSANVSPPIQGTKTLPSSRAGTANSALIRGKYLFVLGHAIDGVDVIHAFDTLLIALMDAIDTQVARAVVRRRRTAFADVCHLGRVLVQTGRGCRYFDSCRGLYGWATEMLARR